MRRLISLLIIGATFLLAISDSTSLELEDATGTSLKFSSSPERLVSLAPSITESLYLLGVEERLVGVTIFDDKPPQVREKQKVGTMLEPSLEKIVSLEPHLVLMTKEGNRPQTVNKLRRLGIKVFVFDESESFSHIEHHFLLLGKIVGQEEKAREVVEEASRRIAEVRRRVASLPPVKVFCQVGDEPLVSVSKGTFLDEMLRIAGGINIAQGSRVRYPRYSQEAVIKENPQVILLATMGSELAKHQEEEWRRFRQLKARIYPVDPNLVCRPLPPAFAEGVEEVAKLLHPEAFER